MHVRLVDYGRSVWAPIDYIYALPLTLGRYPVIAVHCRTQGLCWNVFCDFVIARFYPPGVMNDDMYQNRMEEFRNFVAAHEWKVVYLESYVHL